MNVRIETIPHEKQRYDTCGDWQFLGDDLLINVSKLTFCQPKFPEIYKEQQSYEFLVGIHELIEAVLCKNAGIIQESVDEFDKTQVEHPGNFPDAPYYRQHLIATIIERMLADELDINWELYEEALEVL